MQQKPAETATSIHELLANRWSPRAFAADRPVSADEVSALLEAARWAPSCFNDQPWRFVVCDRQRDPAAWQRMFALLAEKNRLWAQHAPLLVLSVAMSNFGHNGQPNRWAQYDTGAAALSLCLEAQARGLISHQMGGFDAGKARDGFALPENCTPMSVIAVGHPGDVSTLDPMFHEAEQGPRRRAALGERCYFGSWGKPAG